ncbi:MAG TPA: GGDEF domain-containing protein [Fimbriimonadaceae bacterium]|nr:GGDEF domain-containing protein [Fimbriimonadaceae bacterium]
MLPVWVSPDHLVSTARFVLNGHRLSRLPVVSAGGVLGFVSEASLTSAEPDHRVGELVEPFAFELDGRMGVRDAAVEFVHHSADVAPVIQDGQFLGLISALDLLRELSHMWDPLTGLPWAERLRDWVIDNLSQGREVTILSIDVDDFSLYNRRYGHPQGDLLLRRLAERFRGVIAMERDLLVRFGGDEFLVGTLLSLEEAQGLAKALRDSISEDDTKELHELVSFSVGIAGGKRTQEREHTHYAAMFDNLVKLAQTDCQAHKRLKPSVISGAGLGGRDSGSDRPEEFEVISVAQHVEPQPLTQAIIRVGSRIVGGVDGGEDLDMAVAQATARALESWSRNIVIVVESVQRFDDASGSHLVSVTGTLSVGGEATRIAGSARYDVEPSKAIAEAVLDAFARADEGSRRS